MISNPTTQEQKQRNFDEGHSKGYANAWQGIIFQCNPVQYPIDFYEGYRDGYASKEETSARSG
jgi:hypothetical protein